MQPTQVRRPWRATLRTIFQGLIAFSAMWALIVEAAGLPTDWRWVGISLVATGAVTRIMAIPAVEVFLRRFIPFLAAEPRALSQRGR